MAIGDEIRKWIDDKIQALTDWLRDFIATAIDNISVFLRVTKHNIKIWLAEFIATTHGFWISIGVVIALVIITTYVGQSEIWLQLVDDVHAIMNNIRAGLGNVLSKTGFSLLNSAHNIALLLNDDYADAWNVVYGSLAGLSEELRLGISTINQAIRNARSVVYSAAIFAGQDTFAAELEFLELEVPFRLKLEERFARYARNPELIFNDIDREIVWPSLNVMEEGQRDILENIAGLGLSLSEKADQIVDIRDSFDQFVADLPEEFTDAFNAHWAPFRDKVDAFFENWIVPLQSRLDILINEFNANMSRRDEQIDRLTEAHKLPGSLMANVFMLSEPFRSQELGLISAVNAAANIGPTLTAAQTAEFAHAARMFRLNNFLHRNDGRGSITFRVPAFQPKLIDTNTFDVWYRGL